MIGELLRSVADKLDPQFAAAVNTTADTPKETPDSPWATANNAARKVSTQLLRLEAWRRRNQLVADELDDIVMDLNDAVDEAKPLVSAFPGETFGPFNVNKVSVKKGFDPDLLPEHVRSRKGVLILSVDTKVVDALVKCKEVDEADVAPARTETPGSASVRGPQKLVVKP